MTYDAFRTVAARPSLPPFARMGFALTVVLLAWEERRQTRKALARLEDHMLRDIGLYPDEARTEAARPFWQA